MGLPVPPFPLPIPPGIKLSFISTLFKQMKNDRIDPDVISYSAAISACNTGLQWEQGVALFEEMKGVMGGTRIL